MVQDFEAKLEELAQQQQQEQPQQQDAQSQMQPQQGQHSEEQDSEGGAEGAEPDWEVCASCANTLSLDSTIQTWLHASAPNTPGLHMQTTSWVQETTQEQLEEMMERQGQSQSQGGKELEVSLEQQEGSSPQDSNQQYAPQQGPPPCSTMALLAQPV